MTAMHGCPHFLKIFFLQKNIISNVQDHAFLNQKYLRTLGLVYLQKLYLQDNLVTYLDMNALNSLSGSIIYAENYRICYPVKYKISICTSQRPWFICNLRRFTSKYSLKNSCITVCALVLNIFCFLCTLHENIFNCYTFTKQYLCLVDFCFSIVMAIIIMETPSTWANSLQRKFFGEN